MSNDTTTTVENEVAAVTPGDAAAVQTTKKKRKKRVKRIAYIVPEGGFKVWPATSEVVEANNGLAFSRKIHLSLSFDDFASTAVYADYLRDVATQRGDFEREKFEALLEKIESELQIALKPLSQVASFEGILDPKEVAKIYSKIAAASDEDKKRLQEGFAALFEDDDDDDDDE